MTPQDYRGLDALALAGLVARREVSAAEVCEAAIASVEALNPALNAVVLTRFEAARAEAARIDVEGPGDRPLAGVPFLLKDVNLFAPDMPTRFASRFFADARPAGESTLVRRWREAGLVTLGKSNTPEFAGDFITEPRLYGPSLNPWDAGVTVGGSSGGAAVAVAAGMVPARPRHRPRRLDPHPGRLLRRLRLQALGRPQPARAPLGGDRERARLGPRPVPHGPRQRGRARRDRRARRGHAPRAAPARGRLPRRARRPAPAAAHRPRHRRSHGPPGRARAGRGGRGHRAPPRGPRPPRDALRLPARGPARGLVRQPLDRGRGAAGGRAVPRDGPPPREDELEPYVWAALGHARALSATDWLGARLAMKRAAVAILGSMAASTSCCRPPWARTRPRAACSTSPPTAPTSRGGARAATPSRPSSAPPTSRASPPPPAPSPSARAGLPVGVQVAAAPGEDLLVLQLAREIEGASTDWVGALRGLQDRLG